MRRFGMLRRLLPVLFAILLIAAPAAAATRPDPAPGPLPIPKGGAWSGTISRVYCVIPCKHDYQLRATWPDKATYWVDPADERVRKQIEESLGKPVLVLGRLVGRDGGLGVILAKEVIPWCLGSPQQKGQYAGRCPPPVPPAPPGSGPGE